jgi:tetratricopeptide (TPR) repeat protein
LPLAVELVGGYLLRRKNISFQEYYQFLQNEPLERIEKRFLDRTFTEHNKSIIRTLQISERLLNETRFLEDILDILAWSGKSSMGYLLLRELVGTDDDFALSDALGVALELHFIKQEENTERYAIHRLLARVRRHEKPLEQNREWHRKIVQGIEKWFEPKIDDFSDLAEFEDEIAHLNEWQEQTFRMLPSESVLLTALRANPLHHRGNYQKANNWLIAAYRNYKQENLGSQKLLADLNNFLGVNYSLLGNHQEALNLHKQALEMRQNLFGEKHPDVATSLDNFGSSYSDLGNYQEALNLRQQALEMRQNLFGEKHPDVATSLDNLGSSYSLLGNHQEALNLHKQALEMFQELLGEKHPNVARTLNNIGSTNSRLGNKTEAVKHLNSALEMRRALLGERHPHTILTCSNLISVLSETGGLEKAIKLAREFLSYVPRNHPKRRFYEQHAKTHSSPSRRKKKRR